MITELNYYNPRRQIVFGDYVMDAVLKKTLLYDFYGELLTEHQQRIYEEVVLNDYSESEVAKDEGISRQSIHDMIKRCKAQLENYENKLHLIERFIRIKSKASEIQRLAETNDSQANEERYSTPESNENNGRLRAIRQIASEIIEEL